MIESPKTQEISYKNIRAMSLHHENINQAVTFTLFHILLDGMDFEIRLCLQ